ncbi:hypothetical protein F5Y10DRAFT_284396 [Nemania abortiva]|nr:hypothetical protein F5Y10DRAFT_284396 [Nemania abortiva]
MSNNHPDEKAAAYTTLHLSAVAFVHPNSRPAIKECCCKSTPVPENTDNRNQHISIFHTEPSIYGYNDGCYLIREMRYSTVRGWHAPRDDLVADDAAIGSPVSAIGWWIGGGESGEEVWETRVYYIDKGGRLRERTNHSVFSPEAKDEFEVVLPDPTKMIPPTPGWKLTPLVDDVPTLEADPHPISNIPAFPVIKPLLNTKLSAVRSEDGRVYVFYQNDDGSVHDLLLEPGKGWSGGFEVLAPNKAKVGSPLTVISGGWSEIRLFYVTAGDILAGVYGDDHTTWMPIEIPAFELPPTAMLAAVAWNYASPFFELRIYTTDDKDGLYGFYFSRKSGWTSVPQCLNNVPVKSLSPYRGSGTPLSAVTAVITDAEWRTKVYFHPRRHVVEWDVCDTSVSYSGAPMAGEDAADRRRIEEETRIKIKEEKEHQELERKRREEEERLRREEEERLRREAEEKRRREEEERLRQEEEEKRRREEEAKKALPNTVTLRNPIAIMGALSGAPEKIDDVFKELDLSFAVTLYGHSSAKIWVSDNGMLCLDKGTDAYTNRTGKSLPSRENIPPYSMFPFWTDLMISQGKPHGIYYEVVGEAPNRSLTVEWYVTRYGQEDQYFHFNLLLEEARPGVVTYKYYDAVDKGAQCTIGVQGPNAYKMFSYNEPKVQPGLQIVFDTSNNKMTTSRFQV